jgi:hypothetical protein
VDKVKSDKCSDSAIFEGAIANNDLAACAKIADSDLDRACVQKIIDSQKLQADDCLSLPAKEKAFCTDYLSYLSDNKTLATAKNKDDCQKIVDTTIRQFCLERF